jgi:hypothetical protein
MLQGLSPMLESHDLVGTVRFYVDILGFNCDAYEEGWSWVSLSLDDVHIMFTSPNPHRNLQKAIMSGSLYIRTNAVETLWQMLREKVNICYELEKFEYGMYEFAIYDNNGYILQFAQEIPVDTSIH